MSGPLQSLAKAQLTPSGLLLLDRSDGEVELMRRKEMELRLVDDVDSSLARNTETDLVVTITTHRIVVSSSSSDTRFLHLSNIHAVNPAGGGVFSFASYKISVATYSMGEFLLVFRSSSANKDRDDMLSLLKKTLERRAWETASRMQERQKKSESLTRRKVGVDAILSKQKLKHQRAARLTDQAFDGDTETLLREANELVTIIRKYVQTLEQQQQQSNSSSKSSSSEDATRLADMLQDMGMASALSKQDHRGGGGGKNQEYHETLARLLADFLRPKLGPAGGLMTLTDVYCLFNRARGTNLISPNDLLAAVQLMVPLKLGMTLREFSSGVKVVQDDSFDEDKMAAHLMDLAEKDPLTAMTASRLLNISALLAYEQLLAAEQKGYLCRDVTLESTRFYRNRFDEFCQVN